VSTSLLCLAAALSAAQLAPGSWQPIYTPTTGYDATLGSVAAVYDPPATFAPPPPVTNAPQSYQALSQPGGVVGNDGFLMPMVQPTPFGSLPGLASPYGPGPAGAHGGNGPQPYRYGWSSRYEFEWLAKSGVSGPNGKFGSFGFDAAWKNVSPVMLWGTPKVFSFTQTFGLRQWDGPRGASGLPGKVFYFGWDLELAKIKRGSWTFVAAFAPSINSDLQNSLTRRAIHYDGRAIAYYQASSQALIVMGVGYWDRVNDRVIPYGGVVFTPDDRWEIRALFPKSRVSYFIGNVWGFSPWLYTRGEFHVESYEIDREPVGIQDQIEMSDWRIMVGLRGDNGWATGFIEVGAILDRQVRFQRSYPSYDISNNFILRTGLQF